MALASVFLSVLLVFIGHVSGELIQASVGEDVRFPLSEDCKTGRGALNLHLKNSSTQTVASLAGSWKPGRAHTDRVVVRSDCLILKSVDLNDQGLYDFTCEKKKAEFTDLQVFVPSEVVVAEGEDAILPCRSITAGQSVKSARWRTNGALLLELNGLTGGITYGRGFNGSRVSVPSDWYQRADLSVTIQRAEVKDQGVYYCDIDKAESHRSAVRLQIRGIVLKSVTALQPTPAPMSPECPYWSWTTFFITAAVFVVAGLLAWLIWSRIFKGYRRGGAGGERSRHREDLRAVSVSNGGGPQCNSKEDVEGEDGEERESEGDPQNKQMLMSNGYH